MRSKYYLFLDDIRDPVHAAQYTKQSIFIDKVWHIVRDFESFTNFIK